MTTKIQTEGNLTKVGFIELPNCVEVEEQFLGSLINTSDFVPRIKAYFTRDMLYLDRHKIIFDAILDVYHKYRKVDLVLLTHHLESHKVDDEGMSQLDVVGGPAVLSDLATGCTLSYNAEAYASEIVTDFAKRQAIEISSWLTKEAHQASDNIAALMVEARLKIQTAMRPMAQDGNTLNLQASAKFYMDLLEKRQADKGLPKLKFNLWPTLNHLVPTLAPGELVSVLAESGVGKTVFLENIAEDWAKRGWRVAFFHLELNEQTMMDRRMQRATGIPATLLREPEKISPDDWNKIFAATADVEGWRGEIHYVHCPGWTSDQIAAKAMELHDSHGLDVIVVDYFNKIKTEMSGGMNYAQARGYDVEIIKTLVEENDWRCLMAAQFSNEGSRKSQKRGADARDTGELEQKSNVVIVIDRALDGSNQREKNGQIQVVKCNSGKEGSAAVQYYGNFLRYGEVSVETDPLSY